jgi:tetratricopeptide (TPR) repeat protein
MAPTYVWAYSYRADAYYQKGLLELAISDYTRVIEADPKATYAYNRRGVAYLKLNKYQDAAQDFNEIIKIDSNFNLAYYNLACLYSLQKNVAKAIEYLELAFTKGYSDFDGLSKDTDFDNIKHTSEFKRLINKYKK